MKRISPGSLVLGVLLFAMGVLGFVGGAGVNSAIPTLLGLALIHLALKGGRKALVVFGHTSIVIGCYLTAWGIHLAQIPGSAPTALQILGMPLFWGLFSILGGICANFHGFCSCVRSMAGEKEAGCGKGG